jgi:bifunctional non-homologous end joining protein LigD
MTASLEEYGQKRRFERTPEPPPGPPPPARGPLVFVVQKHRARRLHYDFRLQIDGVLASWSVPKGPSLDPRERRLAVQVEDHPFDYGSFEGIIPAGQYGAGEVIVWDDGTYSPDEGGFAFDVPETANLRMREGLQQGKLSFTLRGRKLKGSWALVRMSGHERDWLLIKHDDAFAEPGREVLADDRSVRSGLAIEDLQAGRLPEPRPEAIRAPQEAFGARAAAFPAAVPPMLASLAERPFSHPDWWFEPKLDGIRALAYLRNGSVRLLSRRGNDITRQYPALARALAAQPANAMILDGEIVAPDERGLPSFERLQRRMNLTRDQDIRRADAEIPVTYQVFDVLYLDGFDLTGVPLGQRRALLDRALAPAGPIGAVARFEAEGEAAYEAAVAYGLEGVIAKRRDSHYEPGRRSAAWLKVKATHSEDFVVGGYTAGQGARAGTFGALVLGSFDERGRLVYAGHVGSGFDERDLEDLRERLQPLRSRTCPFSDVPPVNAPTTWVRPELVVEVKYAERTRDGRLRSPVFLRVREDKPASDVRVAVAEPPAPVRAVEESPTAPARGLPVEDVLEQLAAPKGRITLEAGPHKIPLTNLDKPLWPAAGGRRPLTKRDLLAYLAKVSPYLLAHLRDRPLTLLRFPDGIEGQRFYQKHWEQPLPPFVETVRLFSEHNEGDQEYLLCNNLATLLWLGQVATLEFHPWLSRIDPRPDAEELSIEFTGSLEAIERSVLNYPDFIVFDLDPFIYSGREAPGAEPELNREAFARTREAAWWLKELLDSLSLPSFVKTTGKTGLHVYVPIVRRLDFDAARAACETIGRFLVRAHPAEVTMEWAVERRARKVFVDYAQNVRGKTLASVYSPRALAGAPVSMPVRWDELDRVYPTDFTIETAPDRLRERGDLWAGILDAKRDLLAALRSAAGGR